MRTKRSREGLSFERRPGQEGSSRHISRPSGLAPLLPGPDSRSEWCLTMRTKRFELVIAVMMLASIISAGGSEYPGYGDDAPFEGPSEEGASETNGSEGSAALADAPRARTDLAPPAKTNVSGGGSMIPVPEVSSREEIVPIPTLLNKEVWFEIEDRSLNGSGPYGMFVVNLLPTGSPNFNRLLEEAGYSKVREFGEMSGPCSWWKDPRAPTLPNLEKDQEDQDMGNETVQVKRFYVGWAYSKTYHYPDCIWAKNIPTGSQVWFSSPEEARARGYVPCNTCNPP